MKNYISSFRKTFTFALGELAEWSIALVLKTSVPRGTESSNLSLSAKSGSDNSEPLFLYFRMKKTLVVGASPKANRYSYEAVVRLKTHGHPVYAFGLREAEIMGTPIHTEWPTEEFDTVTLYLNPNRQKEYYQRIIDLKPNRVIFNPGTENPHFMEQLEKNGIQTEAACTLVMLSVGNY